MRYSLRSLMIAVLVLPLLVYTVLAVWTYIEVSRQYNHPRIQVLRR